MANKFKIHIEFDGEDLGVECKGKRIDVFSGISEFLFMITEDLPTPARKAIVKAVAATALDKIEYEKTKEDINIEDFIAEIFKN